MRVSGHARARSVLGLGLEAGRRNGRRRLDGRARARREARASRRGARGAQSGGAGGEAGAGGVEGRGGRGGRKSGAAGPRPSARPGPVPMGFPRRIRGRARLLDGSNDVLRRDPLRPGSRPALRGLRERHAGHDDLDDDRRDEARDRRPPEGAREQGAPPHDRGQRSERHPRVEDPFPAANKTTHYGRVRPLLRASMLPTPATGFTYSHWTMIAATGSQVSGEIRVSGQMQNGASHWGVGTDNRVDANGTGDWTNSDKDPNGKPLAVPTAQWLCARVDAQGRHERDTLLGGRRRARVAVHDADDVPWRQPRRALHSPAVQERLAPAGPSIRRPPSPSSYGSTRSRSTRTA